MTKENRRTVRISVFVESDLRTSFELKNLGLAVHVTM